jgi:hypothetical protein
MNAAFRQVIAAKDAERLELFLATARRLGTAVQNVEKDFWSAGCSTSCSTGWVRDIRVCCSKAARQAFINGPFLKTFDEVLTAEMRSARIAPTRYRAEPDTGDADQQTVLMWYPVVTAGASPYIRSAVRIEAGAKSALDPHVDHREAVRR